MGRQREFGRRSAFMKNFPGLARLNPPLFSDEISQLI